MHYVSVPSVAALRNLDVFAELHNALGKALQFLTRWEGSLTAIRQGIGYTPERDSNPKKEERGSGLTHCPV